LKNSTDYIDYSTLNVNGKKLQKLSTSIQVYTGGPYNVAMSLETKEYFYDIVNTNVLFEFFKSFVGLNIFLKDFNFQTTSELFNYRIFFDPNNISQIIPIIGQGYFYFVFIIAPIFSIIFIFLGFYFNKLIDKKISLEIYYFLIIILIRLGFLMGHNSIILVNEISYNLETIFILFTLNKFFGGKNKIEKAK